MAIAQLVRREYMYKKKGFAQVKCNNSKVTTRVCSSVHKFVLPLATSVITVLDDSGTSSRVILQRAFGVVVAAAKADAPRVRFHDFDVRIICANV